MLPDQPMGLTVRQVRATARTPWREVWAHRELLLMLAWRDVVVRYKQTLLGVLWVVVRPLLLMLAFSGVFSSIAGMESASGPYHLVVFAGLLLWQLFSTSMAGVGDSLTGNSALVTKVYFPRLVLPLSACAVGMLDFAVTLLLYVGMRVAHGLGVSWRLVLVPAPAVAIVLLAFGFGLWAAALTARYRDLRQVIPFGLQVLLLISPVGFESAAVPAGVRVANLVNPLAAPLDFARWCLLPAAAPPSWTGLVYSFGVALVAAWSGLRVFARAERRLADVL